MGRPGPAFVLVGTCLIALAAPALAPYDPALATGPSFLGPGPAHLLGTNDIGQDTLSSWLWGLRSAVVVGVLVSLLSTFLSWGVGIASGLSRRCEGPLSALTDLLLALPSLPLYLLIVALVGPSQRNVILTLGLLAWPAFARIVRARVIVLREEAFVEAARAMGASSARIALTHILPGTLRLLPAKLILTVRFAVFAEATLAFLGLGDPTVKSWGTMLGWAFADPLLFSRPVWPWLVAPPALSIVLVVLLVTWLSLSLEEVIPRGGPLGGVESEAD